MKSEDMRAAIEETEATIQERAKLYRKLIGCVLVIIFASAISALAIRRATPLLGLIMLVPSTGAFFVLDSRLTRRWMRDVLDLWAEQKLDLGAFATAIRSHPLLPRGTVEGMLMDLPQPSKEDRMPRLSDPDRRAAIDKLQREARAQERRTILATAALLLAVVCLCLGVRLGSGFLWVCSALSLTLWIFLRTRSSNRLGRG